MLPATKMNMVATVFWLWEASAWAASPCDKDSCQSLSNDALTGSSMLQRQQLLSKQMAQADTDLTSFTETNSLPGAAEDYLFTSYKNGAPRGQLGGPWRQEKWGSPGCEYGKPSSTMCGCHEDWPLQKWSGGQICRKNDNSGHWLCAPGWTKLGVPPYCEKGAEDACEEVGDITTVNLDVCTGPPGNHSHRDVVFRSGHYKLVWDMDAMNVASLSTKGGSLEARAKLHVGDFECEGPSDHWEDWLEEDWWDDFGYPIRIVRTGRYHAHYWIGGLRCGSGSASATLEIKAWPDCFELLLSAEDTMVAAISLTLGDLSSEDSGNGRATLAFCVTPEGQPTELASQAQTPKDTGLDIFVSTASECSSALEVSAWMWDGHHLYFCTDPGQVQPGCPVPGTALAHAGLAFTVQAPTIRQASHDWVCTAGTKAYSINMQPTSAISPQHSLHPAMFTLSPAGLSVVAEGAGWRVDLPGAWAPGPPKSVLENDAWKVVLSNPTSQPVILRLHFYVLHPRAITGVAALLLDAEGEPSGRHVQISKNWHARNDPETGEQIHAPYDGQWLSAFTVIRLPPATKLEAQFQLVFQYFNSLHSVSHAQLSLIGWNSNGHWEEVGLGSVGESITYEPDGQQTRTTGGLDIRPFLVCGFGPAGSCIGTPNATQWTENHGAQEFLAAFDTKGSYQYLTGVETFHSMNGPKLTNVTYTGTTVDGGIYRGVTVSTWTVDDMPRHLHAVRYEFLKNVVYPRLVVYQVGADFYNDVGRVSDFVYGNGDGRLLDVGTMPPLRAGYRHYNASWPDCQDPGPCWFALVSGHIPEWNGVAHRGLVVRKWRARLGGVDRPSTEHPAFYLLGNGQGHKAGVELTVPGGITSFAPGDFIEAEFELFLYPSSPSIFYGTSSKFQSWLDAEDAAWSVVHKEAVAGSLSPTVSVGTLERSFPVRVCADGDSAMFRLRLSAGWPGVLPITVAGVSSVDGKLWRWQPGESAWAEFADPGDYQLDLETGGHYAFTYTLRLDPEGGAPVVLAFAGNGVRPQRPPEA
mmetsp:Transcript_135617/g.377706  ORF Transcript_135617/g.377706 Transcript_135617/m.377706 type:complete len:1031 (+) Transcript_135617:59-3151(+)